VIGGNVTGFVISTALLERPIEIEDELPDWITLVTLFEIVDGESVEEEDTSASVINRQSPVLPHFKSLRGEHGSGAVGTVDPLPGHAAATRA
jgi:hypothetical protein